MHYRNWWSINSSRESVLLCNILQITLFFFQRIGSAVAVLRALAYSFAKSCPLGKSDWIFSPKVEHLLHRIRAYMETLYIHRRMFIREFQLYKMNYIRKRSGTKFRATHISEQRKKKDRTLWMDLVTALAIRLGQPKSSCKWTRRRLNARELLGTLAHLSDEISITS